LVCREHGASASVQISYTRTLCHEKFPAVARGANIARHADQWNSGPN